MGGWFYFEGGYNITFTVIIFDKKTYPKKTSYFNILIISYLDNFQFDIGAKCYRYNEIKFNFLLLYEKNYW